MARAFRSCLSRCPLCEQRDTATPFLFVAVARCSLGGVTGAKRPPEA
jgi:hypothetical protein